MNTITSLFSFPSPQALAPTQVGVSTECANGSLQRSPVLALRAGRCATTPLTNGTAPLSSPLMAKGASSLVAVSTESGMRMWRVIRGLGAGHGISVGHSGRMRALALVNPQEGGRMGTPTPLTRDMVERQMEFKLKLQRRFMADGVICAEEQALLDEQREFISINEQIDEGRKAAISMLNRGEITPWQQRKWRERHKNPVFPEAA